MSPTHSAITTNNLAVKLSRNGVEFVEWVSMDTFGSVDELTHKTTTRVFGPGEKPEMPRINALGHLTHVVDCQVAGNVSNEKLVRCPMGHDVSATPVTKRFNDFAVTALIKKPKPLPAVSLPVELDFFGKPINQRSWWLSGDFLVPLVKLPSPLLPILKALRLCEFRPRLNLKFVNLYRLPRNILKALVPLAIIPMAQKVKMIRVNASSISACVVNLSSMWNNSIEYLKRYAVGLNAATFPADLKLPVSLSGEARGPIPTSGFSVQFKLLYESIKQWSVLGHNEKPTPTPKVNPAVKRGNRGSEWVNDVFTFWRQIQCRAQFLPQLGF